MNLLEQLLRGQDLSLDEAQTLMSELTSEAPEAWKGAALAALRAKGETATELRGMAQAMRAAATPLPHRPAGPLLDTAGTGGDGSHAINVSTATALLVAASGVQVVKHGNRSVSSKSGSADVLEAMEIPLPTSAQSCAEQLTAHGYTFLFAPVFHPSMRAVVPVRRAMGVRTIFNMLGPLTNPARPSHQLLGAFSPEAASLMAHALSGLGVEHAYVVHGSPGWDEATPCGPFELWEVRPGQVVHQVRDPLADYGLPRCTPPELSGGDAPYNARALMALFRGAPGPQRHAVTLNAALCFELLGEATGPEAVAMAEEVIDSGAVTRLVKALRG